MEELTGERRPGLRFRYLLAATVAFILALVVTAWVGLPPGLTTAVGLGAWVFVYLLLVGKDPQYRTWIEARQREKAAKR